MNWLTRISSRTTRLLWITLFGLAFAPVTKAGETLVGRVPIWWGEKTFQLDVTETEAPFERRLTIICTTGCARTDIFTDIIHDHFMGAFRPWDGTPHVITIWGGATAYWIHIYDVSQEPPVKVLEVASKTAPAFLVSRRDGSPVIVVESRFLTRRSETVSEHGVVLRWDGRRYGPSAR